MTGITKTFGRLRACDKVDLDIQKGGTHAIVGENGAGKTTLMRVLYGIYQPDAGSMSVGGTPVHFRSPREAIAAGIGMVSQHYSVIPELSCIDNLMLGDEPAKAGILQRPEAEERAELLARRMGFEFRWNELASSLSPAGCQKLEILKLLWRKAEILILDEPTAMLSPPDADSLFENLRQLADEGKTVVLVTHRLREVMDHCDRVTVMRSGRKVAEADVADTNQVTLANWIVGEDLGAAVRESMPQPGPVRFGIRNLVVLGDRGERAVDGVSLEAQAGQLLGIAGVDGNGQSELAEALIGVRSILSGALRFGEKDSTRASTGHRIASGLRFIPADRHLHGVIEAWSVADNAVLGLQRLAPFNKRGLLDARAKREAARHEVEVFGVKADSLDSRVADLSGGNQQRLVVARALYQLPSFLLAFQPTRGLDIRGAESVFAAIRKACAEGASALVVSFDLDELLEHCDPVYVMRAGKVVARLTGPEIARERIGRLMVGAEDAVA